MDENGIGTDATIHEHIRRIFDRGYVIKKNLRIQPTPLGTSLIDAYASLGLSSLYKPTLRAEMEQKLTSVAEGKSIGKDVIKKYLEEMETIYK